MAQVDIVFNSRYRDTYFVDRHLVIGVFPMKGFARDWILVKPADVQAKQAEGFTEHSRKFAIKTDIRTGAMLKGEHAQHYPVVIMWRER